ncbi:MULTISPECIES: MFS transporter [Ramlibacter]|uniref:MFS transporter n=1 Tax=Ramlibacter pinisoli TaxID=2682844 RepID=A0A6N8IRI8_9BURK|nr:MULTISPECIES: MFS transporter [Ramlibacter]MBA2963759.1 MFS transporter [Ramlibacter sp. CGMCC 1.13660]MVQ28726.1 MFS transporter [Ramlibacter pinisoli]
MLLALIGGFALSQAFRTVAAILAPPLQQEFGFTPRELGLFAGAFHLAFGALQLVMGMGIDVWGPRRTVLAAFPLAAVGALLAATAHDYGQLLLAQVVIGIGCAPAFLACTVFIARRFPADRFAAVSGAAMGLGSAGLLLTGTPLAWVVEQVSWRAGFLVLAGGAALAWLAILLVVREAPAPGPAAARPGVLGALRGYGALFSLRHTWGIVVLASFTYASFLSLRGLWLGPLLVDRHGFTLLQAGNVALAVSVVGMLGPPLFGRLDPGDRTRRRWITGFTLLVAVLYGVIAASRSAAVDVALSLAMSLVSGYIVLQYSDVRSAYPAAMTGRAMAVFTMAMFLGVGLVQWLTGLVATAAPGLGLDRYAAVMAAIAGLLALAALAFVLLPAPTPRTLHP